MTLAKKCGSFPNHLPPGTRTTEVKIRGMMIQLPEHHWGTWGQHMPELDVNVYTDGSKNDPDIDHPERKNAA